MEEEEFDILFNELSEVYDNVRAEVIIADIEKNSNLNSGFSIVNKSSFTRSYKRDIIDVEKIEDTNSLLLHLSRNGLYDSLPEGFFHGKPIQNQSFATQRARYKEEEKQARLFFEPLENEFFNQRLLIEKNERELLSEFSNLKDDFLINFWKVDKEIPKKYLLKLIKLLPFSFKISGDLELTRLCLEKILQVDVSFEKKYSRDEINLLNDNNRNILGVDTVLSSSNSDVFTMSIQSIIGPINSKKIDDYLKENGILKFINLFYEYFIPVDVDISTKIIAKSKNGFSLDETDVSILGVSTIV